MTLSVLCASKEELIYLFHFHQLCTYYAFSFPWPFKLSFYWAFPFFAWSDGAIPTLTLIMGGNLIKGSSNSVYGINDPVSLPWVDCIARKQTINVNTCICFMFTGLRGSSIRLSIIIGVVVVRYIMLPLVGIIVVKGAIRLGLVHSDPLYQFILLVQYALPPAMNIGKKYLC